ncbi:MAG: DUF1624 domain-containing protein [Gemmatimonadetes bacterium]|nr:DUF1624 domain-containing protein [Gemmatimonadota bacterium]
MPESRPARLDAVDVVRGVIMVVMALDHVRDFVGVRVNNPTDPATTTVALFVTRWITHVCAPVFFLLTGVGAQLARTHRTRGTLAAYLATRGLWMLLLDAVIVRSLAMQFNVDFHVTLLSVLWALGWAMLTLSALVALPTWAITAFGAVLVLGHSAFDGLRIANLLLASLHQPGFLLDTPGHVVFSAYPLIPWIGVTALGYALGEAYQWDPARRRALFGRLGWTLIVGFVALRALNVYGDPLPWKAQPTALFTALSFLNTTKYPPSLLFLAMTLGPALLFLRGVDGGTPAWLRPAITYGRVPLFYFILHFVLIHLGVTVAGAIRYGDAHWFFQSDTLGEYPFALPPGWGYPLPVVYASWMAVVLAMYPLCRWYGRVKEGSRSRWLSYL